MRITDPDTWPQRPLIMGIVNVTPDSFSDGGRHRTWPRAVSHALELVRQGADILDIGGESTRPGATPVSIQEETDRTARVIEALKGETQVPLSIDTRKPEVAEEALARGASVVNDVSGFADTRMIELAEDYGAVACIMHMLGDPRTMQAAPHYDDVRTEVRDWLAGRAAWVESRGLPRRMIWIDPGIGFGKTTEHNLALLRALPALAECGCPLLIGASRKSFIGELTGKKAPIDRRAGSLGAAAWVVASGAHILRVHDVIDTCDVCRMLDTFVYGDE